MFWRIMVAIITLCCYKGELNTIASSKWLYVKISSTLTLSTMHYCYYLGVRQEVSGEPCV